MLCEKPTSKKMATVAILRTCNDGTLFNQTLLEHIELRNEAGISSILQDENVYWLRDSFGNTLLHFAAEYCNYEFAKHLIDSGADLEARNQNGKTPLASIRTTRDQSVVLKTMKTLLAAGAKLIDGTTRVNNVYLLLHRGTSEIVRTVLQYKIDLNFEDNDGMTSLHYLASNTQPDILQELSHLNIDVNLRTRKDNSTMLHHAAKACNASSIQFLLNRGADVDVKNDNGRTPLYIAISRAWPYRCNPKKHINNCVNCVEILLKYGADPQILTMNDFIWIHLFRLANSDELLVIIAPLFADVAIIEARGMEIGPYMQYQIESYPQIKRTFIFIKQQIEEMKRIKIGNTVTLFEFFTVDDTEILLQYTHDKSLLSNLKDVWIKHEKIIKLFRKLEKRFFKFNEIIEWRITNSNAINEIFAQSYNTSVIEIAEKIVDYLHDAKWIKEF